MVLSMKIEMLLNAVPFATWMLCEKNILNDLNRSNIQ